MKNEIHFNILPSKTPYISCLFLLEHQNKSYSIQKTLNKKASQSSYNEKRKAFHRLSAQLDWVPLPLIDYYIYQTTQLL